MRTLLPAFFAWTGCSSKSFSDSSAECARTIVHTMTQRITAIREYTQDNNPLRVLIVGSQYDSECRNIRTFLSLNRIPYEWVDNERDPDRVPLCVISDPSGPFVLVDGSVINPQPAANDSQGCRGACRSHKSEEERL